MADESDSPLSEVGDTTPPDSEIESALRGSIIRAYKQEAFENLTLKRVRAEVAEELGLPEDFLKADERWKIRSKEIVNDEVAKQEETQKAPPTPVKAKQPPKAKSEKKDALPKSTKRKSSEPTPAQSPANKRRKQALPQSSDVEEEEQVQQRQKEDRGESSPLSEPKSEPDIEPEANGKNAEDELGPESELSDVLDETPRPKAKRKPRVSSTSKAEAKQKPSKATVKAKSKAKPDAKTSSRSPQEEEIKKLQGQLGKCGIRRLWGKELAQFDTPAEKIAHLKEMLRDVGMGGRFSEEKARQIREERELKADLESIQEGEERWGKAPTDAPRRLVPKGLMELQGLADDEEDSD